MSKSKLLSYLPSAIAVIAVCAFAWVFDFQSKGLALQESRAKTQAEVESFRARLQAHIDNDILLTRGLAYLLSRQPNLPQEEYRSFAAEMVKNRADVINMAWAPDLVIRNVYPPEGNERAIGLDYRKIPTQLGPVLRARDTGQIVLVGPVDLVQGGQGFILRVPVYSNGNGTVKFEGILSAVFDVGAFLDNSGIKVFEQGLSIVLTANGGEFTEAKQFFTSADPLDLNPVTAQVLVPGGSWTMRATPLGGWASADTDAVYRRLLLLAVAGLIVIPMFAANLLAVGRKNTISQMQDAERRLKGVISNTPGTFISFVTRPNGTEYIDYISENCIEIWGVTAEEAKQRPERIWSALDEKNLDIVVTEQKRALAEGRQWHAIWKINSHQGEEHWLEGRGHFTETGKGEVRRNSYVVNISEKVARDREYERQAAIIRQSQKQEAIGHLTGGVAHDFNNLLAVIRGSLELLRDDIAAEAREGDDHLDIIDTAIRASDRGSDLTRSMLSFARQARLVPEVVNINEVVEETHAWARRTLPATINVSVELQNALPRIEVDRSSTASALLNLIVNARDAMSKGGNLHISTAKQSLSAEDVGNMAEDIPPGTYVVLSVQDEGEGIAAEQLEKIFEPFFTTKSPGKGSGLGLSMVEGFVRQSGGAIQVQSEQGTGTKIRLFFRALDKTPSLKPVSTPTPRSHPGQLRILVAEDDDAVRMIMKSTLSRLGHQAETAANGDAALERFRRERDFDLLVTDIVMPGQLQGDQLAIEIRKLVPNFPVIFLTGYANDTGPNTASLSQSEVKLMKPVRRQDLAVAIETTISRRLSISSP